MKRFLATTLATISLVGMLATSVSAGIELTLKPSIEINGTKYECIIKDSSTYMPIRAVFEALGFTVDWDEKTKSITIYNDKMTHIIITGTNEVYHQSVETVTADGHEVPKYSESGVFEHKIVFDNSRTYLPFRELLESMGYTIGWDPATKTATVKGVGREPSSYNVTKAEEFIKGTGAKLAGALGYESTDDMTAAAKDKVSDLISGIFTK